MESPQDRLIRYLDDAWAVEKALVTVLGDMAEEVNDPQVRALFQEHRRVTHEQEERLEARIRALGKEPSGGKGFFNQMVAKIGDVLHAAHDDDDKTTQDLMKAYATENFECAMYQSLASYATAIGDGETAQLARQHMQQEKEAADRVWPLIQPTAARPAQVSR
jgi:ferritin-like metal-binding protein YciE